MTKYLKKLKRTISDNLKSIISETSWFFALRAAKPVKRQPGAQSVLLIPAADLEDGFGEDIMVISFLSNFAQKKPVTILSQYKKIIRKDYLKIYNDLDFVNGFTEYPNYSKLLPLISNASLVYIIGADIMDGVYGDYAATNRFRVASIAHKMGVAVQFSGISVSKNVSQNVKDQFTRAADQFTFKARDIESYKRMQEFIPAGKLLLTNDIAFLCPDLPASYEGENFSGYDQWVTSVKAKNKKLIAICPNSIQAKKIGLDKFVADHIAMLDLFLKAGDFALVFLYHDLRLLCDEHNDSTISKILYDHYQAQNVDCYYTDKIKNGVELKGYLSKADFTVTGRMHFGISGTTYGKPMFGIAYYNKFEGMVRLFDIDTTICLVDYTKMDQSQQQVAAFVPELENLKLKVTQNLSKVQADTQLNFKAN